MTAETVKKYGLNAGASVVGIAASEDFVSAPNGRKPTDILEGCRSVIVLGAPFDRDVFGKSSAEYTRIRQETVKKTGDAAKTVAKQIKKNGYKAAEIVSLSEKISLKHAAELAGIGTIGKNYLLANPEHGNLLWFSAVLTDAELIPDKKSESVICENCNKCVEICPQKALGENPEAFDKKKCAKIMMKIKDKKMEIACFLCRKICPYRLGK